MTTAQEQFVDIAQRSQETAAKAFQNWTDTVQGYPSNLAKGQFGLPNAQDLLNNVYDFAEQMLHGQREFATSMLTASAEVTEATRKATEQATEDAKAAAPTVAEEAKTATAQATRSNGAK